MGLEKFNTDEVEEGETYYEYRAGFYATIEYPGLHEKLPRDIRNMLPPRTEYEGDTVEIQYPFWVTGRGYSREEAHEAMLSRAEKVEDVEFSNELAEVTRVDMRRGSESVEEIEK